MRSVVVLAVIVLLGAVPAACGGSAAAPTSTPAGTATAAASPTPLATATQPQRTAVSGQLAFAGVPEGASASAIYLVGSDGAGPHAVWTWETVGSHAVYLVWSPDGRQLAFFGHDAGAESSGLYVLDADRGSVTRLLEVGIIWGPAAWSPDGRQLYVSLPPSPLGDGGIWVVPADGSAAPALLTAEPGMGTPLTLSPDGQKIAASVGAPPQLGVMSVDDSQMRVVGGELIMRGAPVWSPDSRQIAFIAQLPADGIGQLYVVNADGTQLSKLTAVQPPDAVASGSAATDPVWSPDGQQIAYTVLHATTPATQQTEVYLSSVDGSHTRNLSNDPEHADTGPSWSPDGREIAFVSQPADAWRDPGNASGGPVIRDIRVIMADGTNPRTVVAGVQFEFFMELSGLPEWRPTAP